MLNRVPVTHDYVCSILSYDPDTGEFRWRHRADKGKKWNAKYPGRLAGANHNFGYVQITINGQLYMAHRLAVFIVDGVWPRGEIDHVNLDKKDNRLTNLRHANRAQNLANTIARSKSGAKGVVAYVGKKKTSFRAQITINGRTVGLGTYKTPEEANHAYFLAAKEYHGEYARAG